MKELFIHAPLRGALIFSLIFHLALVGWASTWVRPEAPSNVENLGLVSIDAEEMPPVPPEKQEPEPSIPPLELGVPPGANDPKPVPKNTPTIPQQFVRPARPVQKTPNPVRRSSRPSNSPRRAASSSPPQLGQRKSGALPSAIPNHGISPLPPARNGGISEPGSSTPTENGEGEEPFEEVPEGPVDLETVDTEEEPAVKPTRITRRNMAFAANAKVKGEVYATFADVLHPFNGPGPFFSAEIQVPLSAPPGTTYQLEITNVVLATNNESLPITIVPGQLTILPSHEDLPPHEEPVLKGVQLGAGNYFAHRGDKLSLFVYAGEGVKNISGVQAKLVYRDVKVASRKIKKKPDAPISKPPTASSDKKNSSGLAPQPSPPASSRSKAKEPEPDQNKPSRPS